MSCDERPDAPAGERGRHLADQHRARPEALDGEAEARQRLGRREHAVGVDRIEIDHLGDEQELAGDAGAGALAL